MTVRHVVLFRFHADAAAESIGEAERAFAALATQIGEIQQLEWGTNISPEGLDRGFTHCFSLGFADTAARDAYLVHPRHVDFTVLVKPLLADVLVIDYDSTHREHPSP